MSEVFDGYERNYCELSAGLFRKCNHASAVTDAGERKMKLHEIQSGIEECDTLIKKMDLEARSLPPSAKATLLAKMREYKADLNKLKREIKRVADGGSPVDDSHDELLESGLGSNASAMSIERLNQSGERIKESRKAVLETEEIGISILEDLHQQRQTLLHAHSKLHGVDDAIDKSKRILSSISRRITKNKWIFTSVVGALVAAILFILYFKLTRHR